MSLVTLWCSADGPDLTKNPKDLADDAKQGVKNLVASFLHPSSFLALHSKTVGVHTDFCGIEPCVVCDVFAHLYSAAFYQSCCVMSY